MSVIPFRAGRPIAVVSIGGANWSVEMFGGRTCRPLGTLEFAIAESAAFCAAQLRQDGWRVLFGDGAKGIRDKVEEGRR